MYFTLICKCIIGTWKYFFDLRQEMPEAINALELLDIIKQSELPPCNPV